MQWVLFPGQLAQLVLASCLLFASACATSPRVIEHHTAYARGDLAGADRALERAIERNTAAHDCLMLDRAMIALADGRAADAEVILRQVRDRFDYLAQPEVSEAALSLVADDNQRAYAGEPHERILLRSMLAVSDLMQGGEDAVAYCLQAEQAQRQLLVSAEDPDEPVEDRRVAFARYLLGIVQEVSHVHYDDAARSYATVAQWEPTFHLAAYDRQRAAQGVHSQPGYGVVYLFAFVGRGPRKIATNAPVTSEALLLADRLLSAMGDHSLPPTVAPVKVAALELQPSEVESVEVLRAGSPVAVTSIVTNIETTALRRDEATRQARLARAVARRALKKAAVYTTKDTLGIDSGWANLLLDLGGIAWEASEKADLRSWSLLPASIQVCRVELPQGRHALQLRSWSRSGSGPVYTTEVDVEDGRNTYLLACFPTARLTGKILQATP